MKPTAIFERRTDFGIEEAGRATVADDGTAIVTGIESPDFLQQILRGISPDGGETIIKPEQGEEYVKALPRAFRGSSFWARAATEGE